MFGMIRTVFGNGKEMENVSGRERFMALAGEFQDELAENGQNGGCTKLVGMANNLRNMLRSRSLKLSRSEKIMLVKAVNQAKVKALMGGTDESFRVFSSLDSISSDMVQLL